MKQEVGKCLSHLFFLTNRRVFVPPGTSSHQREGSGLRGEGRELAAAGAQGALVHEAEPGRGGACLPPRGHHHQ